MWASPGATTRRPARRAARNRPAAHTGRANNASGGTARTAGEGGRASWNWPMYVVQVVGGTHAAGRETDAPMNAGVETRGRNPCRSRGGVCTAGSRTVVRRRWTTADTARVGQLCRFGNGRRRLKRPDCRSCVSPLTREPVAGRPTASRNWQNLAASNGCRPGIEAPAGSTTGTDGSGSLAGKVYLTVDVNQLVKITSERSRGLLGGTDTTDVADPCRASMALGSVPREVHQRTGFPFGLWSGPTGVDAHQRGRPRNIPP